ncbi:uncharacterized protein DNG_06621 [Cephalotrichum gorgonifer]|uniref:Mechanosensitive ion channel protein n=1 Tax=Cephalotrichum gorgonifer TaxID=2041049 RepID=A0AAE8N2T3_9PEZI|nr:uncharacterized protein DNG_06621 [Cephalotrichum gorgonifer]
MTEDIPLHTVKSHASSTGARRGDQVNVALSETSSDEKHNHHMFHGGRRKADGPRRTGTGGTEDVSLNFMGRLYTKIINFNTSLRYLIYIVPVGLALAVPIIVLAATNRKEGIPVGSQTVIRDNKEVKITGPPLFRLFLWIEIAWLTIWAGKVVAHLLPAAFMFVCGVVSSGTRKYATVLHNLVIPLSLFFWALASFITFRSLFKESKDAGMTWVRDFERVLGASFVSSAVYLGEKAIVQLIGISYHQRSFANRIRASKSDVRILGILFDASRALFPMYCPEFADEDYIINDSIEALLARKGKKGAHAVPMRLVGDVGRLGDKVTSIFGNIASEITGKEVFNPNSAHSIVVEALEKTKSSEALGRRIWMSFAIEGRDSLLPDDIAEVLGDANRHEAEAAFKVIDVDENGDISLDEMVRKVVDIGKERKAISEGMKDISQALQVFDKVLLFIVLLIVIFIFLAFFQSTFITTLATAGTALLSLSFVFAVTTQEFLGSCIFLFVKHPYDVGDRVDIAVGAEKIPLQVEKISLLYTVFIRVDKMQVVQTPNIILNNLWIENVTRSGAMSEFIDVNISFDTSFDDVELLRIEMEKFVRDPENSRDFQNDFTIGVSSVGDLDKLQLHIAIKHKSNWHNETIRLTRRSKFICALTTAIRKIPIYAPGGGNEALGAPGNPSYSVAVSDADAEAKREEAKKAKEAKRMFPSDASGAVADPAKDTDWFNRTDKTVSGEKNTRTSLDSTRTGIPVRGESQSRGLRKAGETLSTTNSRTGSVSQPAVSGSIRRSVSRGRYDEESQVGSPITSGSQRGRFLAASTIGSQHSQRQQQPQSPGGSIQSPGGAAPYSTTYQAPTMTPVLEIPNPYNTHPAAQMQGQGMAPPPKAPGQGGQGQGQYRPPPGPPSGPA